jgi:hypothetical protein
MASALTAHLQLDTNVHARSTHLMQRDDVWVSQPHVVGYLQGCGLANITSTAPTLGG